MDVLACGCFITICYKFDRRCQLYVVCVIPIDSLRWSSAALVISFKILNNKRWALYNFHGDLLELESWTCLVLFSQVLRHLPKAHLFQLSLSMVNVATASVQSHAEQINLFISHGTRACDYRLIRHNQPHGYNTFIFYSLGYSTRCNIWMWQVISCHNFSHV